MWRFTGAYDRQGSPLFYCKWLDLIWWMGLGFQVSKWFLIIFGGGVAALLALALTLTALHIPPYR